MSNENDGWETIEVSEDAKEVDFEIEAEQEQPGQVKEEEQPEQKGEPEQPKELEGIETKGA